MIPDHCSQVGIRQVSYKSIEKNIREDLLGSEVYYQTRYLVIRSNYQGKVSYSVVEIHGRGYGLFNKVEDITVISLPMDTGFVTEPKTDVLNHNSMASAAGKVYKKVVVVEGEFGHISFVRKEWPIEIKVVDVIPPMPSKLLTMTDRSLKSMSLNKPVVLVPKLVNLDVEVKGHEVIYSCRSTDLSEDSDNKFLQEMPDISDDPVLVGCNLSRKIFMSKYNKMPRMINSCPKALSKGIRGLKIVKCCEVLENVEVEKDDDGVTAIVPWGMRIEHVRDAVRRLIEAHEAGDYKEPVRAKAYPTKIEDIKKVEARPVIQVAEEEIFEVEIMEPGPVAKKPRKKKKSRAGKKKGKRKKKKKS
jgi:hypothetical protein